MKPVYRNRKTLYTRERCQEAYFKRRKLEDHGSIIAYDRETSSENISNSRGKGIKGEKSGSAELLHRASGLSSSVIGHQASFESRNSHVKFSIKSFKVPEQYIEVPETATVGSLKRTVMEAVTAILRGGLCVGVLLQGKKVRDDNRTLLQTGISQNGNLDSLGFTLEPSSAQASPLLFPKDPSFLLPCDAHQQLTRSPASPIVDSGFSNALFDPPLTNLDNHVETSHELVPSPTDVLTDVTVPDSRALVAIPAMNVEALAVVPVNQKTRLSELGQRRTRRPFSVSEVEALVEAVEKLGTGRWRDVKLCAFDNENHRTYVDLKDKWKTLVHTASISPQQRRGQPVPQELLDRVLSAHSYWSRHQSKQHGKHLTEPLNISEALVERVGV
uniref:Putative telomere repeat-binding protein 4 isoform X1 n=1 Tax=Davidia involucrata TaxID=16924 RepID=A0A5B7AR47_DAVIN